MTEVPTIAPPPPVERRVEYQPVPVVNRRAMSLEEAMRREVQLFARHKPIIDRILHTAEQIDHGDGVNKANRGATGRGLGWSDE